VDNLEQFSTDEAEGRSQDFVTPYRFLEAALKTTLVEVARHAERHRQILQIRRRPQLFENPAALLGEGSG
jgi:hypothetical protein